MDLLALLRTLAFGLLGIAILWLLASAVGVDPRSFRHRLRLRRAGGGVLLCGSCGHPADALGSIDRCPECGAVYSRVGLHARATTAQFAPSLWIVSATLLGVVTLGALVAAPWVAGRVNHMSFGTTHVQRTLLCWAARPARHDPTTGLTPPIAVQMRGDVVESFDPAAVAASTFRHTSPYFGSMSGTPRPKQLAASVTVHLTTDIGFSEAWESWQSHSYPPTSPPAYHPYGFDGSWEAMHAALPTHALSIRLPSQRWTLRDPQDAIIGQGVGLTDGIGALFQAAGVGDGLDHPWHYAPDAIDWIDQRARGMLDPSWQPSLYRLKTTTYEPLHAFDQIQPVSTTHRLHHAAPWGLVAAASISLGLLVIAAIIFWLCWRRKRALRIISE